MANDAMHGHSMTAEAAYDVILDLFENPEPSEAWVDEFNNAANAMESRCDDGIDDGLPTTNHVLPWRAFIEKGTLYVASPPIVLKGASVRLVLDVIRPLRGNHVNVHAIPCDDKGKMIARISNANTACIVIDSNAGPATIFAGWDFVAREGIDAALKSGAILKSWVQVITSKVPCVDISTEEQLHALKMLGVYANDKDLERACLEYRKIYDAESYACMEAVTRYNKIRFHLELDPAEYKTPEAEQVRINRRWMKPKAYAGWLLDGVQMTGETVKEIYREAIREIYGDDKKAASKARDTRNMAKSSIVNTVRPGSGLPLRSIPEEFFDCIFLMIEPDESTNRIDAIRSALLKIGRKSTYDGEKFANVEGLVHAEVSNGFDLAGTYVARKFKGIIVDPVTSKVAFYSYKTCLRDDDFHPRELRR